MAARKPRELPGLMTLADIAQDLGVTIGSARVYQKRAMRNRRNGIHKPGDLPVPDLRIGRVPVWKRETYLAWKPNRPGQGWNANHRTAAAPKPTGARRAGGRGR